MEGQGINLSSGMGGGNASSLLHLHLHNGTMAAAADQGMLTGFLAGSVLGQLILQVVNAVVVLCLIFGAPVAYVEQYQKLRKGQGAGFSTSVSFLLLVSNMLRLLFYFSPCGDSDHHHDPLHVVRHGRFEKPLLYQSFVMMLSHLLLIHAWCSHQDKAGSSTKHILDRKYLASPRLFLAEWWAWSSFDSYVIALLLLVALAVAPTYVLGSSVAFFEILGYLALGLEAGNAIPQMIKNIRQRSCVGVSRWMVWNWMVGDVGKTLVFVLRQSPTQFIACGLMQVGVDTVVLLQLRIYTTASTAHERKRRSSEVEVHQV